MYTRTLSQSQDSVSSWNPLPIAWLRQPYAAAGPIVHRRCRGRRKRWGLTVEDKRGGGTAQVFTVTTKDREEEWEGEQTGEKVKKDKEEEARDRRNKRTMTGTDKRITGKRRKGRRRGSFKKWRWEKELKTFYSSHCGSRADKGSLNRKTPSLNWHVNA